MLWMLLFLLLITFWVDLRIRGLREEFLRHCLLMERCISRGQLPHRQEPSFTTDAKAPGEEGLHAPWFEDMSPPPSGSSLPRFIDDIVPTREELSRALKGVDALHGGRPPTSVPTSSSFQGYEGTIYAPVFPPSMQQR